MRESRRARRIRAAVTALVGVPLLCFALAGCVGIPTSGAVTAGEVPTREEAGDLEFLPSGPTRGASQEEIVRGFVAAFTSSASDFDVAREYLSEDFSEEWNPQASVVVRAAGSADPLTAVDDDSLRYSVEAAATVDAAGAFREVDGPEQLALAFDLVEESGQWRIAAAPDGIVLSDALFERIYSAHSVYFLAPVGDRLVPDVRWFPGGTATLRIVSALLDGPPEWLRGAVRSAFPDGTQLESVDGRGSGSLTVDLSDEALSASARDRQLMQAQLSASLAGVGSIGRAQLVVSGTPLAPGGSGASTPRADPPVDDRALVSADGEFGYLSADGVAPLGGLGERVVAAAPTAATVASDGEAVAVLGPAGVSLIPAGSTPITVLDVRPDLIAPALDPYGFVWATAQSDPATIRVFDAAGAVTELATGLAAGARPVSVDVSRDGARVALLAATATGQRLLVASVVRDPANAQRPLRLGEAVLDATVAGGAALDATWVDDVTVATLAQGSSDGSTALAFVVGGERESLGQLPAAVSVAGGNGVAGLRALGSDGALLQRRGNVWVGSDATVAVLATQG